jgi:hypothetical protein
MTTYDTSNPLAPTIDKGVDSILDYSWDWSEWLTSADADTITGFTVTAQAPLALVSTARVGSVVTAFVSGGNEGAVHQLTCEIVTAGGRTEQRSVYLRAVQR